MYLITFFGLLVLTSATDYGVPNRKPSRIHFQSENKESAMSTMDAEMSKTVDEAAKVGEKLKQMGYGTKEPTPEVLPFLDSLKTKVQHPKPSSGPKEAALKEVSSEKASHVPSISPKPSKPLMGAPEHRRPKKPMHPHPPYVQPPKPEANPPMMDPVVGHYVVPPEPSTEPPMIDTYPTPVEPPMETSTEPAMRDPYTSPVEPSMEPSTEPPMMDRNAVSHKPSAELPMMDSYTTPAEPTSEPPMRDPYASPIEPSTEPPMMDPYAAPVEPPIEPSTETALMDPYFVPSGASTKPPQAPLYAAPAVDESATSVTTPSLTATTTMKYVLNHEAANEYWATAMFPTTTAAPTTVQYIPSNPYDMSTEPVATPESSTAIGYARPSESMAVDPGISQHEPGTVNPYARPVVEKPAEDVPFTQPVTTTRYVLNNVAAEKYWTTAKSPERTTTTAQQTTRATVKAPTEDQLVHVGYGLPAQNEGPLQFWRKSM